MDMKTIQECGNNPLLILNRMRPGIQYRFINEFGEPHAKMFTFSINVDNRTFEGTGMKT